VQIRRAVVAKSSIASCGSLDADSGVRGERREPSRVLAAFARPVLSVPSGAAARRRSGAAARRRGGAAARWRSGAVARWRSGAVAQRRGGAAAR